MINVVKDKERLININPLVVYFILSEEEHNEYCDDIRALNNYVGFTRGIFSFESVVHSNGASGVLPSALTSQFGSNNLLVRLLDDVDGSFQYLCSSIELNADEDTVEQRIIDFVVSVCRDNVAIAEHRNQSLADANSCDTDPRAHYFNQVKDIFTRAINKRRFKRGVWRKRCRSYDLSLTALSCSLESSPFESDSPFSDSANHTRMSGVSSKARRVYDLISSEVDEKDMQSILLELLGSISQLPDFEDSKAIAEGVVNDKYADNVKRDHYSRFQPQQRPSLSISVKRISTVMYREKSKKYGVEIVVNGHSASIYFSSKDQTMLYFAALLRHKIEQPLYLHELYNNSKGHKSKYNRDISRRWLKSIYELVFGLSNKSFDTWYSGVDKQRGKPLYQGKSQINNRIQKALCDMPDAIYYCLLNIETDSVGNTYYYVRSNPSDILVDDAMQSLCDKFETLYI